jgi:hypothetical protein
MQDFKFFEKGTIDIMDGATYTTASFTDDTPEGYAGRRRLYHTNIQEHDGQNNVIATIHNPNTFWTQEETERIRRLQTTNDSSNVNPMRLYRATTTITVNPTPWTKVKIFGTKVKLVLTETWKSDPMGFIVMTFLSSILMFIGIMKLFGA